MLNQEENQKLDNELILLSLFDIMKTIFKAMPLNKTFYTTWIYSDRPNFLSGKGALRFHLSRTQDQRWSVQIETNRKPFFGKQIKSVKQVQDFIDTDNVLGFVIGSDTAFAKAIQWNNNGTFDAREFIETLSQSKGHYHNEHILTFIYDFFETSGLFAEYEEFLERDNHREQVYQEAKLILRSPKP